MYDKIIFSKANTDCVFCFKYVSDKLDCIEYCDRNSIIDNIYVGVISDYVANINAAFVNFGENCSDRGFLSLNEGPVIYLNIKNSDKPCKGDKVLVQVSSDRIKSKDYTLTCNISLKGRFLVLTKTVNNISISKKIKDNSLRNLYKEILMPYSNEYGFIVRTNACGAIEDEIINDAQTLIAKYNSIFKSALSCKTGDILSKENYFYSSVAVNAVNKGCNKIYTDIPEVYTGISTLINDFCKSNNINYDVDVKLYRNTNELNLLFGIDQELSKATQKKVWMKSGAYLVIENTEALNVIDVNTGKIIYKKDRESMFLKVNLEAADISMREIRKRNLTGIIIIDFINMKSDESKSILLAELKRLAQLDEINTNILGFTNLGLIEITRKRNKKPLHEIVN